MKLLGIDYGTRRVGLAMTDPEGMMAYPLPPLANTGKDALFAELARVIEAEKPEAVVVGMPRLLVSTGPEGSLIQRQIRNFIGSLRGRTGLPVHEVDESLTSAEAAVRLREAGRTGRKAKAQLDSMAAVLILETFLSQR